MLNARHMIAWLLLVLLVVVGGGAAAVGIVQSPNSAPLPEAVKNTLAARNYSEVLTENVPQGKQTDYLTWQAPDRLGGYIQSGNKRTYVYVIGTVEYQSVTVTANASTKHLVFYKQNASGGAAALDPARGYLPYASEAKNVQKSGDTYSFTLTQTSTQGVTETGMFTYMVSGKYVSEFTLNVKNESVQLIISQVGTSPPVALPAGAKVVTTPIGASGAAG
jgi:hypothetical protein